MNDCSNVCLLCCVVYVCGLHCGEAEGESLTERLEAVMDPAIDSFGDVAKICITQLAKCMRNLFKSAAGNGKLFGAEWCAYDPPADPKKK